MINPQFYKQADLLIRIIPEISREKDVALHGGLAINLFYNEMPRLSVDIDLTFLPTGPRDADLTMIISICNRIKERLLQTIPGIKIKENNEDKEEYKLFCSLGNAEVKVEVNTINRGVYSNTNLLPLCKKAQQIFKRFCDIQVVPAGQLFGGKIVAALDRQHPRDLYDVKQMMETIGYTDAIAEGFLFCLLSSKRPFYEILHPSLLDHRATLASQFNGMTDEVFSYEMYESTRLQLIKDVILHMSNESRDLLINFSSGQPEWHHYDYGRFPGIQWKLQNIRRLKEENPSKHEFQLNELKNIFYNDSKPEY
ncbi:MAG: nucleotidyl transferase AbiEii/AbiGii toxin family protein [Lentimicrobiaceae bacterium]|jgi:predicted nucleotidyltransferase component of viral defense system